MTGHSITRMKQSINPAGTREGELEMIGQTEGERNQEIGRIMAEQNVSYATAYYVQQASYRISQRRLQLRLERIRQD